MVFSAIVQQNTVDMENYKRKLLLKEKELEQLKEKLDNNPGLHTLEYIEEKFEKWLENMKKTLEQVIKAECKSLAEKSYN